VNIGWRRLAWRRETPYWYWTTWSTTIFKTSLRLFKRWRSRLSKAIIRRVLTKLKGRKKITKYCKKASFHQKTRRAHHLRLSRHRGMEVDWRIRLWTCLGEEPQANRLQLSLNRRMRHRLRITKPIRQEMLMISMMSQPLKSLQRWLEPRRYWSPKDRSIQGCLVVADRKEETRLEEYRSCNHWYRFSKTSEADLNPMRLMQLTMNRGWDNNSGK
jgi:hypothetical protein